MNKRKLLPILAAGFAAAVLGTIPGVKNASCCLLVPASAVFSLFLYTKMNNITEKIRTGEAIYFGFMTGIAGAVFATLFELLITYITRSNEFVALLPQTEAAMRELNLGPLLDNSIDLFRYMAKEISATGFSALYSAGIFFSNILMYSVFGMLGGLLGSAILNKRMTPLE
jgi:hypothetical protein